MSNFICDDLLHQAKKIVDFVICHEASINKELQDKVIEAIEKIKQGNDQKDIRIRVNEKIYLTIRRIFCDRLSICLFCDNAFASFEIRDIAEYFDYKIFRFLMLERFLRLSECIQQRTLSKVLEVFDKNITEQQRLKGYASRYYVIEMEKLQQKLNLVFQGPANNE